MKRRQALRLALGLGALVLLVAFVRRRRASAD